MSNSPLISGTLLTDNCYTPRAYPITRITPHYMAWYTDAKTCCESFVPWSRRASANYCIGKDGEIWLNVDESNAAWTSGNYNNDNRAITIECANYNETSDGHVYGELPKATWESLVSLCADIVTRNGYEYLEFTGETIRRHSDAMILTMHKWFQSTDCPGPWLENQFDRLASEVNYTIHEKEICDMTFLFRPDGDTSKPIHFYDGGNVFVVGNPDEEKAIRDAYRRSEDADIPLFALSAKFLDCLNRKV